MTIPPRVLRIAALTAATLCAGAGACLMALNLDPTLQLRGLAFVLVAAFIPYGIIAWAIAALGFGFGGRRVAARLLAVPCLAAMILQLTWAAPYWPHAAPTASGQTLRILSFNVNFGKADSAALSAILKTEQPDIVILMEIQAPLLDALTTSGALGPYTSRIGSAPAGYLVNGYESDEGTYVLSRTPMTQLEQLKTQNGQYVVKVQRPGGDVTLIATRPRSALLGVSGWINDYATLTDAVTRNGGGPLVVAGDFNATRELDPFRRLLGRGLTDAAAQSGAGWLPTYPANVAVPMIAIDHVLCNAQVTARSIRTVQVRGTDHLGLLADLVIA